MCHEVGLEVGEVGGEGDALLLAAHEGLQLLGDGEVDAEDAVYGVLEFCWMCGLEEDACFIIVQLFLQRAVAAGTVGVEDVAGAGVAVAHGLGDLVVGVGGAGDERPCFTPFCQGGEGLRDVARFQNRLHIGTAVEVEDAGEVGGVADVHGIGYCLLRGLRGVDAGLEVVVEDIVGVVGGNEAVDGKSHDVTEEGRADVAEVAGGDADS